MFGPDKPPSECNRLSARSGPAKRAEKKKRMARSDLLVALVKAGATGDRHLARTSAEALIADERGKQHNVLADRLSNSLRMPLNGSPQQQAAPDSWRVEGLRHATCSSTAFRSADFPICCSPT